MVSPPGNEDSQSAPCYHKSMSGENDNNLINFSASAVETMRQRIDTVSDQMATKVDLASLKDQMATDIAVLKDDMATKNDLARVESGLETLREQMATKEGLGRLETTMHGEFEQVHLRLDSIDRGMGSRMGQIETEVSRLRRVVYLLVKDKPDILRLLGPPTPGESRPQG